MSSKIKSLSIVMITFIVLLLTGCNNDAVSFEINFDSNGGSIVESVNYDGSSTITIPDNPTKEGFIFDGWYWDNGTFEVPFTANSLLDTPIEDDLTVYAKWVEQDDELTMQLKNIYLLAVQVNAFQGTYEEWLETVRGPQGVPGEDGKSSLIRVNEGILEWQLEGDSSWTVLYELNNLAGSDGIDGQNIILQVADGYIQWQYTGDLTWTNLVELTTLVGPAGADGVNGIDGKQVTFQVSEGFIQWQYVGDTTWNNLISIATITGADGTNGTDGVDGREVLFQVADGFIQWQYTGDLTWTNLIELTTLVGPAGADGVNGIDGKQVTFQVSEGFIQWQYLGDITWNNLLEIDELKGEDSPYVNKLFTVYYNLNYGTMPTGQTEEIDVMWGETIDLPIPYRFGYEFSGWFTEYTINDKQFYNTDAVFNNINLYAKWTEKDFSNPTEIQNNNVNRISATNVGNLPTIGAPKILVFEITFEGYDERMNYYDQFSELEDLLFSEENKYGRNDSNFDSLRSYYYRSSYGKLDITGDVYRTTLSSNYTSVVQVAQYLVLAYQDIDFSNYDSNNDGYIDGFYIVFKTFTPFGDDVNVTINLSLEVDGYYISQLCILNSGLGLNTYVHETYHMFGFPDVYEGVAVSPNGVGTPTVMNSWNNDDIPTPAKFLFGWIDDVVYIKTLGEFDVDISSLAQSGNVIVVYPKVINENNFFFFIDFVTDDGNYSFSGVRIWKVSMSVDTDWNAFTWGPGMTNSPFEYIECLKPRDVYYYFFSEGESVTPYTDPSTAIGNFKIESGSNNKYLDDLIFSGISITINTVTSEFASITIDVQDVEDKDVETPTVLFRFIQQSGVDWAVSDRMELFEVFLSTNAELRVNSEASPILFSDMTSIQLDFEISSDNKKIIFYIDKSNYSSIEMNTTFRIFLDDCFTFYTGLILDTQLLENEMIEILEFPSEVSLIDNYSSPYNESVNFANDYLLYEIFSNQVMYLTIKQSDEFVSLNYNIINSDNGLITSSVIMLSSELRYSDLLFLPGNYHRKFSYWLIGEEYFCVLMSDNEWSYFEIFNLEGDSVHHFAVEDHLIYSGLYGSSYVTSQDNKLLYSVEVVNGLYDLVLVEEINTWFSNSEIYSNFSVSGIHSISNHTFIVYCTFPGNPPVSYIVKNGIIVHEFGRGYVAPIKDEDSGITYVAYSDYNSLQIFSFDVEGNLIKSQVLHQNSDVDGVFRISYDSIRDMMLQKIGDQFFISIRGNFGDKSTGWSFPGQTLILVFDEDFLCSNYYIFGSTMNPTFGHTIILENLHVIFNSYFSYSIAIIKPSLSVH